MGQDCVWFCFSKEGSASARVALIPGLEANTKQSALFEPMCFY